MGPTFCIKLSREDDYLIEIKLESLKIPRMISSPKLVIR
jgi:hypothetical protein